MSPENTAPNGDGNGTIQRRLTILNSRGLHARAAAKFAKMVGDFDAEVMVCRGDMSVSGLSIMGLMMLAASPGSEVNLAATGAEAEAVLDALEALITDKFGEDKQLSASSI